MLIVTDGAVDVPEVLLGSPTLRQVPGTVWAGEAPFVGERSELWSQLRKGVYPSTTPPTVSALVEAYSHSDVVVALHVSGDLSATVARAREAAKRVTSRVEVVDTRSLSVGAGLIVAAVHRVQRGSEDPAVINFALSLPARLHTFALVQDVESLRRSDRAGLLPHNHLVRNHPLVLAVRGRAIPLNQPKHRSRAINDLLQHLQRITTHELGAWALGHGDASDVEPIIEHLSEALGCTPAFSAGLDPTVAAHLGPDSIVVGAITGTVEV